MPSNMPYFIKMIYLFFCTLVEVGFLPLNTSKRTKPHFLVKLQHDGDIDFYAIPAINVVAGGGAVLIPWQRSLPLCDGNFNEACGLLHKKHAEIFSTHGDVGACNRFFTPPWGWWWRWIGQEFFSALVCEADKNEIRVLSFTKKGLRECVLDLHLWNPQGEATVCVGVPRDARAGRGCVRQSCNASHLRRPPPLLQRLDQHSAAQG